MLVLGAAERAKLLLKPIGTGSLCKTGAQTLKKGLGGKSSFWGSLSPRTDFTARRDTLTQPRQKGLAQGLLKAAGGKGGRGAKLSPSPLRCRSEPWQAEQGTVPLLPARIKTFRLMVFPPGPAQNSRCLAKETSVVVTKYLLKVTRISHGLRLCLRSRYVCPGLCR